MPNKKDLLRVNILKKIKFCSTRKVVKILTCSPLIGMFKWKGKSIVNSSEFDDWFLLLTPRLNYILVRSVGFNLIVTNQPIVIITVSISNDVVEDNQSFKLMLEFSLSLIWKWIMFQVLQHN